MNIIGIQTNKGAQNTIPAVNKSSSYVDNRAGSSSGQVNSNAFSAEIKTTQAHEQDINDSLNLVEKLLDQLLVVHYPPFFPIATYQRLDLIKKIKGLEEEMEKSSLSDNLKKTLSNKKLPDNASDNDISDSLEKLHELRDKLIAERPESSGKSHPGSIVDIKV